MGRLPAKTAVAALTTRLACFPGLAYSPLVARNPPRPEVLPVFKKVATRIVFSLLVVGACAFVSGCLSGGPSYLPYLLTGGAELRTHSKPIGPGYFADFDPNAYRIEMRPGVCTAPVRGTQVFIATVYDRQGVPRRARRVEWMVEGVGSIIEVDESGFTQGRGMKVDNKFAYSQTDYFEHSLNKGGDEFTIGPGQTWCVVSGAIEGETVVTAYAPAVADWSRNRAYSRIQWTEAGLIFPAPVTARAGGELSLTTRVQKAGGLAEGYRVRYKIADGPAAALTARGGPVDDVTEATTTVNEEGFARVTITQPLPSAGKTRVDIEIVKPNPDDPTKFTVVSKGETTVTWQETEIGVKVSAPRTLALNQEAMVRYELNDVGKVGTSDITLTARVPEGMDLIRTEPRAVVDGDTLIWTIAAATKNKPVQAIYRPARIGSATLSAEVRTKDGVSGRGSTSVRVMESKLTLQLEGPKSGTVGEALPFQIRITNEGQTTVERVRVQARFDDGLETASKAKTFDETIPSLAVGQSRTLPLPLSAKKSGKLTIEAGAAGKDNLEAVPQTATIDIQEAALGVTAVGPPRGFIGEEVIWQLVIRNTGEVPVEKLVVKATLPPEVRFVKATDGGKGIGQQVVWDLGSAPGRQERTIAITVRCEKAAAKATLSANVSGTPSVSLIKPTTLGRPATTSIEIVGVPALQMSLTDSNDPVGIGQRTTYTIRVKNAGTMAATKIEVGAEVPGLMRPVRATGPGAQGKIEGQKVTFPMLATLAPNAEATFVIEVEGLVPGEARFRAEAKSPALKQPIRAEEPTRVLGGPTRTGGGDF
ncbi:MAG: DUF11 domain-containing protein [Gemmataceae bacterium]|nr:DUF11 domain-containing protein [Gemmataceae bacterium]